MKQSEITIKDKDIVPFFAVSILLPFSFCISHLNNDATFISVYMITVLLCFTLFYPEEFIYFIVVVLPFTYIITVFLYNADLFNNNFKLIAAIKLISFTIVPIVILFIKQIRKYKLTILDMVIIVYIILCTIYTFVGEGEDGSKIGNFMQMVPFAMYLILGKLAYLSKINLVLLENIYIKLCLAVILVGIIMYLLFDKLYDLNLSPKAYSIESVGMKESQFVGELAASSYSFIFYEISGLIKRFFSIFYSGIGMAYFLAIAFFLSLYRSKYFLLCAIAVAIVATLTRAVWMLVFISPVAVIFFTSKTRKIKYATIMLTVIFILASGFAYKDILIGYFMEGRVTAYDFASIDQSAAAHIIDILVLLNVAKENIFGYGLGYNSGESFLVDVFARTGIAGFSVFIFIFVIVLTKLKHAYFQTGNTTYRIALCLLIFNLTAGLFSRESFTIIVSYMSWIYIGYTYSKAQDQYTKVKHCEYK